MMEGVEIDAGAIQNVRASQYVTVAIFCLLVYDHVLTFSDELNLVWQSRSVNLVKALFIFNRYVVPVFLIVDTALMTGSIKDLSTLTCHRWIIFDIVMEMLSLWSTTLIIALRVRVLWVDRKDIKRILIWTWSFHVVASLTLTANAIIRNQPSITAIPGLNVCSGTVKDGWAIWLPTMIFHLAIFGLVSARAWYTRKEDANPLLRILLIDGFVFFFFVFSSMLINLLIWAVHMSYLAQLPYYSVWALSTVAITRLLLSLQKRFHNHHVAALETCDDNNDSPDTDSACWPRVPSVMGSPLEDPFYAYYTAPFPMVPEIEPSTRRYSSRSSKRRTVTSTQSARSIMRPGDRQDGNYEHEGMSIALNTRTPRTNDALLVPPIPFITALPPIPDV